MRLRFSNEDLSWDTYSIAIIFLFCALQVVQWPLLPKYIDSYYHLCAMLGMNDAGGFTTHAFWEYAPVGRPNLYPPLLHVLMLAFYKIGCSAIFIARLFDCLAYPLSLLVIWLVIKKVFYPRLAFFILLIISSVYSLYLVTLNFIPFTLALLLGLLAFLCIEKKRLVSACILLGLTFYAHSLMSWLVLLAILIYGLLNRERLKNALIVCVAAIILGLPFLLFQYQNRQFFGFIDVIWNYLLEINILVFLFSALGLVVAFKRKKEHLFFVSLAIATSVLLFKNRVRFLSGQGLIGLIFLAAVALDWAYEKFCLTRRNSPIFIFSTVVLFYVICPVASLDLDKHKSEIKMFNSTIVNLMPNWKKYTYLNENSLYHPKFFRPIAQIIKENTQRDDIIWVDFRYMAGLLSALSERATASAMVREIKPYYDFDPLASSKMIIWFKDPDGKFPEPLTLVIEKYSLTKIGETDFTYIYLNPAANAKRIVSKPLVSTPVIFAILFLCLGLVVVEAIKLKKIL